MKRTTLVLEDGCIDAVRALAQQQGRQLSEVVNELLAEGLVRRNASEVPPEFALPCFDMGIARADLADRDALEAAMED